MIPRTNRKPILMFRGSKVVVVRGITTSEELNQIEEKAITLGGTWKGDHYYFPTATTATKFAKYARRRAADVMKI